MPKSWYQIKAQAEAEPVEVLVYDEIGFWGVTALDFINELKPLKARNITLRLNSPGGSVSDGIAIYNYLRSEADKGVTIKAVVDGWAASIASVILLAADERVIAEGASVMIHNASACLCGTAADFQKAAEDLERFNDAILGIYEARTGQDRAELASMMAAETWLFGQDAVDRGFATALSTQLKAAACAQPRTFNFKRQPATAAAPGAQPKTEMKNIAKLLGLGEDATETQVAAAITRITNDRDEAKALAITATAERDEMRTANEKARKGAAEAHVDAAIKSGAITAETKGFWVDAILKDEAGAKAALASIKVPSAPTKGATPMPAASQDDADAPSILSVKAFLKLPEDERKSFIARGGRLNSSNQE